MPQSPLMPVRHPQRDFFIADIFDSLPFKDDLASMEHPIFSLQTNPQRRALEYKRGNLTIKITPSIDGLPTIHDKGIILYCISQLMDQFNRGETPPKTIRFSAHDLLVATNQPTNGDAYDRLKAGLQRLNGVTITTNIKTNRRRIAEGFHLIEKWRIVEKCHKSSRMIGLEVTLSDWFYNACIAGEVLTISPDYFRLRKPIERRLYELARKHCGHQTSWPVGLDVLREKTGSNSPMYKFRYMIKKVAQTDHLPDYRMDFDAANDQIIFSNRAASAPLPLFTDVSPLEKLKGETVARARKMTHEAGTGWDFHALTMEFANYLAKKGMPDNINGAFIGFVKKKVAIRP